MVQLFKQKSVLSIGELELSQLEPAKEKEPRHARGGKNGARRDSASSRL